MRIAELVAAAETLAVTEVERPEADPFGPFSLDALDEAQVLGTQVDSVTSRAAILFEMRTSDLGDFNAALLIAHGVRSLRWETSKPGWTRTAWTVTGWQTSVDGGGYRVSAGVFPGPSSSFSVLANRLWFVAGSVPGISLSRPTTRTRTRTSIRTSRTGIPNSS